MASIGSENNGARNENAQVQTSKGLSVAHRKPLQLQDANLRAANVNTANGDKCLAGPSFSLDIKKPQPKVVGIVPPGRPLGVPNIDERADNESRAYYSEYAAENYHYLHCLEETIVCTDHLWLHHPKLKDDYRSILINWLNLVHMKFRFVQETLYLCVGIMDSYFQKCKTPIPRDNIQLVGIVSLMIAAKVEELQLPSVRSLLHVASDAYSLAEFFKMELDILSVTEFVTYRPVAPLFLRRCSKAAAVDRREHTLAKYIMELGLSVGDFAVKKPSLLAAAALRLAMLLNGHNEWNETVTFYSTYTENNLRQIVQRYASVVRRAPIAKSLEATVKKYGSERLDSVSKLTPQQTQILESLTM